MFHPISKHDGRLWFCRTLIPHGQNFDLMQGYDVSMAAWFFHILDWHSFVFLYRGCAYLATLRDHSVALHHGAGGVHT